jgi:hypothetical protein
MLDTLGRRSNIGATIGESNRTYVKDGSIPDHDQELTNLIAQHIGPYRDSYIIELRHIMTKSFSIPFRTGIVL